MRIIKTYAESTSIGEDGNSAKLAPVHTRVPFPAVWAPSCPKNFRFWEYRSGCQTASGRRRTRTRRRSGISARARRIRLPDGASFRRFEAPGLEKNTLVIFTSDNGPLPSFHHARTGGLRGSKLSLYEGGIRVPFIVRWPGHTPAGRVDERTVLEGVDLFPTLCAIAHASLPAGWPLTART